MRTEINQRISTSVYHFLHYGAFGLSVPFECLQNTNTQLKASENYVSVLS
jgi:hypothetical protein